MKKSSTRPKPRASRAAREKPHAQSEAKDRDPRLAAIARAFAEDARVSSGGRGFGGGALKVKGKIFAMISSRGAFVVKLSQARVSELVQAERGSYFDAGKGKPMKEWLAVASQEQKSWLALAREAHAFVLAASER